MREKQKNKEKTQKIDWENQKQCKDYEHATEKALSRLDLNRVVEAKNRTEIKAALDMIINEMNSALRSSYEKAKMKNKKPYTKKKEWWDEDMTYLKEQFEFAYQKYRDSEFRDGDLKVNPQRTNAIYRY